MHSSWKVLMPQPIQKQIGYFRYHKPLTRLHWFLTRALRACPNFIIIGAQRSGTTTLYQYLSQHPHIKAAFKKEIHYFDNHYQRGISWYRSYFPLQTKSKSNWLTGEASPYYLLHPLVPQRIASLLPDIKLIAILRNPVKRAYSHYWHEVRLGRETLSFVEAIEAEESRIAGEQEQLTNGHIHYSYPFQHYTYLSRGVYIDQLARWQTVFDRSQMLILASNNLFTKPVQTLNQVFTFLDLPPFKIQIQHGSKPASYPPLSPTISRKLSLHFQLKNEQLYQFLGEDLGW